MNKRRISLFLTGLAGLLLLPAFLLAEEPEVKRERVFTGTGLYGFMNGGADQFLEYGVSRLVTRDVAYKGEEFTVDVYDMSSPEDAFGIYSLHIFKCARADNEGCIDCLSPYQLQAVVGSRYVSVVFPSGSEAARRLADQLVRHYAPAEGLPQPAVPEALGVSLPYSGRVKLLRGPISVSSASTSLSRLLDGVAYTGVWFIADKPGKGYKALIQFSGEKEKAKVASQIAAADRLAEGPDFLYIFGKEKETEEEDYGGFGF